MDAGNTSAGLRLSVYYDKKSQGPGLHPLLYGQRIRVNARLRPLHNYGNPGDWDQRAYWQARGIVALGTANAADMELLPGFGGTLLGSGRARCRRSVVAHMAALWPGKNAPVMAAMRSANRPWSTMRRDCNFSAPGFYHVLVVSGMNVGILAFVIFWVVRRLGVYLESTEYDMRVEPKIAQLRLDLRLIIARRARLLPQRAVTWGAVKLGHLALDTFEVLLIAALMQVVMVLPMAVYFHRAALLTVPANSVVVPLTGVLRPAGWRRPRSATYRFRWPARRPY